MIVRMLVVAVLCGAASVTEAGRVRVDFEAELVSNDPQLVLPAALRGAFEFDTTPQYAIPDGILGALRASEITHFEVVLDDEVVSASEGLVSLWSGRELIPGAVNRPLVRAQPRYEVVVGPVTRPPPASDATPVDDPPLVADDLRSDGGTFYLTDADQEIVATFVDFGDLFEYELPYPIVYGPAISIIVSDIPEDSVSGDGSLLPPPQFASATLSLRVSAYGWSNGPYTFPSFGLQTYSAEYQITSVSVTPIPEPLSTAPLATACVLLGGRRRRRPS